MFAELLGLENEWTEVDVDCDTKQTMAAGITHYCEWTYNAPTLDTGQSVTYSTTGRVYYRYSSSTLTSITFGTHDEIRQLQDSGQALPTQVTETTNSPVKVTVDVHSPIRFSESESSVNFPLFITVENIGGGTVCNTQGPDDCKDGETHNKVSISMSASDINFGAECNAEGLSLISGTNTYSCEATATDLPDIITQQTMTATAVYSYYILFGKEPLNGIWCLRSVQNDFAVL